MQTRFTQDQLSRPEIAEANNILRACVHCGFCTAVCPTYVLEGNELDSPRGRIYLIKELLEHGVGEPGRAATDHDRRIAATTTKHLDRCLSCYSCMTACPAGVDYLHLSDIARARLHGTRHRPPADRFFRTLLSWLLANPRLLRLVLLAAAPVRHLAPLLPARIAAMLALAPGWVPRPSAADIPQTFPPQGRADAVESASRRGRVARGRVALLSGCAQQALAPRINEATIRLLTRYGIEVVVAADTGCCGALAHHLGATDRARAQAARNIRAWATLDGREALDAVIVNASGCGTVIKDYGHLFAGEAGQVEETGADAAVRVAGLARDLGEYLVQAGIDVRISPTAGAAEMTRRRAIIARLCVAYHGACSLKHGQGVDGPVQGLLRAAGFRVVEPAESHLCCGSAGIYNMMRPGTATRLRVRKQGHLAATGADLAVAGNLGCITQIGADGPLPILHWVELLDWATGGPLPPAAADAIRRCAPR